MGLKLMEGFLEPSRSACETHLGATDTLRFRGYATELVISRKCTSSGLPSLVSAETVPS